MCRVLAERKLVVGGGELLLFEKRVSGLHNTASTEMKQRQSARERKRQSERARKKKKKSCEALTDDLTGETEFVFCREMSDALPVRERDGKRKTERERDQKRTTESLLRLFHPLLSPPV